MEPTARRLCALLRTTVNRSCAGVCVCACVCVCVPCKRQLATCSMTGRPSSTLPPPTPPCPQRPPGLPQCHQWGGTTAAAPTLPAAHPEAEDLLRLLRHLLPLAAARRGLTPQEQQHLIAGRAGRGGVDSQQQTAQMGRGQGRPQHAQPTEQATPWQGAALAPQSPGMAPVAAAVQPAAPSALPGQAGLHGSPWRYAAGARCARRAASRRRRRGEPWGTAPPGYRHPAACAGAPPAAACGTGGTEEGWGAREGQAARASGQGTGKGVKRRARYGGRGAGYRGGTGQAGAGRGRRSRQAVPHTPAVGGVVALVIPLEGQLGAREHQQAVRGLGALRGRQGEATARPVEATPWRRWLHERQARAHAMQWR